MDRRYNNIVRLPDRAKKSADPFDPDNLRLPHSWETTQLKEQKVETDPIKKLKKRKQEQFVYRVPLLWMYRCMAAGPYCLGLAQEVSGRTCLRVDAPQQRWVKVTNAWGDRLGLSRDQRLRTIKQLEAAGLLKVKRVPNNAPEVKLIPSPIQTSPA